MQSHEFGRHRDGWIDFEFYRGRAKALRRRALRDAATRNMALRNVLVIVAVLSVAIAGVAAAARMPGGPMMVAPSGVPQVR
jgi:hypothetical protein